MFLKGGPRNAGCYHYDYSDDWERLVQLKLIKQEDTEGVDLSSPFNRKWKKINGK